MWTIASKDEEHLWKKSYWERNTKFDINSRFGRILIKNAGRIVWYRLNLTINYSLTDKGYGSQIKELIHDLKNKQYVLSIVPEKIIHMSNGIKYYYV